MKLLPLALLALSQTLSAQSQGIPGAGSQLRQLPAMPTVLKAAPEIRIDDAAAAPSEASDATRVLVKELRVTGASVYPDAELIQATGFTPGAQLTLGDLQNMASRITSYYRERGYFVARAYLPAQAARDNAITIAVSEGQYGAVKLNNHSRLQDGIVRGHLAGIEQGDAITLSPLESRLLTLSDIPGVKVQSTLAPGTTPGSSDLIVDVVDGRRITGSIDADNAGNPYTGAERVGATLNLNNPLGRGDVATARVLTSGSGLQFGRVAYQMPTGRATIGAAYSKLHYELGDQFEILGANGEASVASVFGTLPLRRGRDSNLTAGLAYDDKHFEDRLDLVGVETVKGARVATASLFGNSQDRMMGGGANSFIVSLSAGNLDIETPGALAADAASARTNGSYQKLSVSASRMQRITDTVSLRGTVTGQLASKNLDASEKLVLGGMDGVRAYPQGEGFGDQGVLVNLEARKRLAGLSGRVPGDISLVAFADGGSVTINKNPWTGGANHRSLSGGGAGITWEQPGSFAVRMYYAQAFGNEPAISAPDKSGRFWIQAVKTF